MKKEQIQQLVNLGWEPRLYHDYNDTDFHLRRVYDITHQKELYDYIDYEPLPDERIFVTYELYPNLEICHFCIWSEYDEPSNRKWDYTDYKRTLQLALEDKLIVYSHWLEVIARENNLTINQLAKKSNIHHSTLYKIIRNKTKFEKIKLSTLKAIAKGLDMSIDEFIYYIIMIYGDNI